MSNTVPTFPGPTYLVRSTHPQLKHGRLTRIEASDADAAMEAFKFSYPDDTVRGVEVVL